MFKWLDRFFKWLDKPKPRQYLSDDSPYYWDRDWIRLDIPKLVESKQFKDMCENMSKLNHASKRHL